MILGCDPGLDGAFALYDGTNLQLYGMPTQDFKAGPRQTLRRFLHESQIIQGLKDLRVKAETLVIEQVGGIPGQAAHSAFMFGHGCGLIVGAALALGYRVERVPSPRWKGALSVPADKKKAVNRAGELMPQFVHLWAIQRGTCNAQQASGRAEAAMIALYGWQTLGPLP